jgi:hypothetical protein
MEKKLAVWLVQRRLARDVDEGLEFAAALERGECTEAMVEANRHNMDAMAKLGKVTQENLGPYMQEKLAMAKKLIAFWEENPKDTNAIFFFKAYGEKFGEERS